MAETVGMMEGAFFVGKAELLAWLNDFFKLSVTKVEQLASGAVYIQIFDAIFPGKVQMTKVNWAAKFDYEFIKNYKILQSVFDKVGIKKHIEVDKLVKAKPLDNLEFIQWCKAYFDKTYSGQPYDAIERRLAASTGMLDWAKVPSKPKEKGPVRSSTSNQTGRNKDGGKSRQGSVPSEGNSVSTSSNSNLNLNSILNAYPSNYSSMLLEKDTIIKSLQLKIAELDEELLDSDHTIDGLEKERDFYFRKLRDVEVVCQERAKEPGLMPMIDEIQAILYANEPGADKKSDQDETESFRNSPRSPPESPKAGTTEKEITTPTNKEEGGDSKTGATSVSSNKSPDRPAESPNTGAV